MLARNQWLIAMALGASFTLATLAEAQLKLPFKRRTSTKEQQSLTLTQSMGPWLIMCASFSGERGVQQARQLANELRVDHGLNAYIYRHQFDHSKSVQGSGWDVPDDEMGLPVRKNWKAAGNDSFDQVAVVVGDFSSVDDASARATLGKIKTLAPRSMVTSEYVGTNQVLEQQYRAMLGGAPLSAAFMMPNPYLPSEYFRARDIDKVVLKMNKGIRHSLLKCPGNYSVRVATFSGERKFNATSADIQLARREFTQRLRSGKAVTDSDLVDAAYKANVLCRALRKKGVEAYEFHDRHESYVCVGSFERAANELKNGKQMILPEIADVIRQYKGTTQMTHHGPRIVPRTLAVLKGHDINFDAQPIPVIVPKIAAKSKRGLFGR